MNLIQDELASFFQAISHVRTVPVVGVFMLDRYQIGDVIRISREAPVPLMRHTHEEHRPGGAGNVSQNLSSLNIQPNCYGFTGQDAEGKLLFTLLSEQLKADTRHLIIHPTRPTPVKTRFIARNQQLLRVDREEAAPLDDASNKQLTAAIFASLEDPTVIFVSDYDKGAIAADLVPKLRERYPKAWICADPKGLNFQKYRGADLITPNQFETEQASGMSIHSDDDAVLALQKLYALTRIPHICMTRSDKGMMLYAGARNKLTCQPAWSLREVYDVTGAGDTVLVFVGLGLSCGIPVQTTLKIASLAAYLVIQKLGASGVSMHEMVQGSSTLTTTATASPLA